MRVVRIVKLVFVVLVALSVVVIVLAAVLGSGLPDAAVAKGPARVVFDAGPTPEQMAAAVRRHAFAANMNKLSPQIPATLVKSDDTVIVFTVRRCEEETPVELLRSIGKARLRELGFRCIGCIDAAEVAHFHWFE